MYIVLDLETTTRKEHGRKANPFYNKIVGVGYKCSAGEIAHAAIENKPYEGCFNQPKCLIGFNFKFDMLYLWENKEFQDYLKRGGKVFCCQIAEYTLTGQQHKFPALRDVAVNRYGCKPRKKQMEEYWDKGIDTSEIPKDLVLEDVKQDVLDTEQVYLKQVKQARKQGMLTLINLQMPALLACTEFEFNGMYVNKEIMTKNKKVLQTQLTEVKQTINTIASVFFKHQEFNPGSSQQLSFLLFGGSVKIKIRMPLLDELDNEVLFKTGNNKGEVKTHLVETVTQIQGFGVKPKDVWKQKAVGVYKTGDKVLKKILQKCDVKTKEFIDLLLLYRKLSKEINTYYTGFENKIYPDGCVRSNFNLTKTETARLSGDNPNLQNIPKAGKNKSLVKNHMTSRYGEDGVILEVDLKQAEICVMAFLTQDPQLIEDLNNGVDLYRVHYAEYKGIAQSEVTDDQRQQSKGIVLGVGFGKGAKATAEELNITVKQAEEMLESFFNRYRLIKQAHKRWSKHVQASQVETDELTPLGYKRHYGTLQAETGRILTFKTNDAPQWLKDKGIQTTFNPPDVKNYPVQSLTGDVVKLLMGIVFYKAIHHRDKFLTVNMVHDSLVFDCRKEFVDFTCNLINDSLQLVKPLLKDKFKIDFNVPLRLEFKQGTSWGEMTEFEPNEVLNDRLTNVV